MIEKKKQKRDKKNKILEGKNPDSGDWQIADGQ